MWFPGVRYLEVILHCKVPLGARILSGIEKRPLLGGCLSITSMVISIRNTDSVRCREVVRFSEGPLSYMYLAFIIIPRVYASLHRCIHKSACTYMVQ